MGNYLRNRVRRGYLVVAALAVALAGGVYLDRHVLEAREPRDAYQTFETLWDLRTQILRNYVEKVDEDKLLKGAINGMLSELDPYSNYFTKEEFNAFDKQSHGQFSGIGAEMSQDPQTKDFIIVTPIEDSPALKAGILAGDRLLQVDGKSLEGLSLKELTQRISGAPDTIVKLTVVHEGEKTPVEISVKRGVVQVHSIKGYKRDGAGTGWDYLLDPEHRIAYVRITNFMDSTAADLDRALLGLIHSRESLRGIILDLRFNPGGLLKAGVDVADRFLDSGAIVSVGKPGAKDQEVYTARVEGTYPKIPLVVLVNEYSASAAEIVAGALKDHRRGVLIGTRSFGKGSVQNLVTLDNGNAALKLTTHYYYLPSGKNIARKKGATSWGVEPDAVFAIPLTDAENRAVLQARASSEIIRGKRPTTQPVAGATTRPANGATTKPGEAVDRQLQRALEILVANQVFTGEPARVSTTRMETTATIEPPQSRPAPETKPAPATAPVKPPESAPAPEKPSEE